MWLGKMFVATVKFIWKLLNLIREIIANILFLLIILLIVGTIAYFKEPQLQNTVPQEGLLVLDLQGVLVDTTPYNQEVYQLLKKLNSQQVDLSRENSLFELTKKIEQARYDNNIKGLIIKLDNFVGSDLPSLQYVGKYLEQFRQSKKPIYAIGSSYAQSQYYLASYADKVYLTPQGSVNVYGFAAENLYYKTLLDNLKVNTHIFRVGTYKSAVEPFTRNDMSEAARSNTTRWLTGMWSNYLDDIAANREQSPEQIVPAATTFMAKLGQAQGSITDYALKNGLVDKVIANYQFNRELTRTFNDAPQLSIYDYQLTAGNTFNQDERTGHIQPNQDKIAIVFVNGTISSGINGVDVAGSETITQQLHQIGMDNTIKAVVLRINSPGGSVQASEAIRSEVEALRNKGLPVVVSMGGMAASGGYWIATQSDYIIASANTITGSIGIFGIIPTFEKSLDHIGVYADGVTTSPLASMTLAKELTPEAQQLIQYSIESGYQAFLTLVADARAMTTAQVDKIAQGQVWLGQEAKQIGLVDKLGDLDEAINKAASLAKLTDYQIDWQQPKATWFESLLVNYSASLPKSAVEMVITQLPEFKALNQQAKLFERLNDPQNRYLLCLACVDIK